MARLVSVMHGRHGLNGYKRPINTVVFICSYQQRNGEFMRSSYIQSKFTSVSIPTETVTTLANVTPLTGLSGAFAKEARHALTVSVALEEYIEI